MKKRFEIRRSVERPIEIISSVWEDPVEFYTADLSPRGGFIVSEYILDMGEQIVCSFDLGAKNKFVFLGEVKRINLMRRKTDVLRPGFGIKFLDAGPMERIKIRYALRGTPPPVPMMRRAPGFAKRVLSVPKPGNQKNGALKFKL